MELYHKQINSVAELRRERERLKKSMKKARKVKVSEAQTDASSAQDAFRELFSSKGSVDALRLLEPLLLRMVFKKKTVREEKHESGFLKKALVEVLGGYVKWKAIELSLKLVKKAVRKNKEKKQAAAGSY